MMDFRVRQFFEFVETEFLGEGIYTGMSEELFAAVVDVGCGGVLFYTVLGSAETTWEVFACILVLQETADRIERFMW